MIIIVIASDQMRGEAIDRHELCIVDRITVEGGCQNPAEQCDEEQKCAHTRIETKIHCCAAERHREMEVTLTGEKKRVDSPGCPNNVTNDSKNDIHEGSVNQIGKESSQRLVKQCHSTIDDDE